jgi:hypothetical protein
MRIRQRLQIWVVLQAPQPQCAAGVSTGVIEAVCCVVVRTV